MRRTLLVAVACALACSGPSLHQAVRDGDTALVQTLLANGADPNALDAQGLTPRRRAEELGRREIFHLLLVQEALVEDDGVRESREGPPPSERYAARVLADLGHEPSELTSAIRAFQDKETLRPTGELSEEVARLLWIRDPITRRKSLVPHSNGECHVCVTRFWRRPRALGLIQSMGGCDAPPEAGASHVILCYVAKTDLPTNEIVEIVTRSGECPTAPGL